MSKNRLKRLYNFGLALITALLVLFFGGCTAQQTTTNTSPNPASSPVTASPAASDTKAKKDIKVGLAFLIQSLDAPLMTAIQKGYFTQEGLNVTFERGSGNVAAISNLGANKFDIAFSDIYNMMEFNDKNPNERIKAVGFVFNRAPFSILTLKKNNITEPRQLAGKKLGAPAGDGPRKLWPLFAKEIGVDANSVEWVTMEPKLRETFLIQGQVDAISGFSTSALPSLYKAGLKEDEITVFYYNDFGLDFYGNAVLVKEKFAQDNPEVVKSFLRAYMKGLQDTLKDPEAGLNAVMAADESKLMDRAAEKVRLQIALEKQMITPEVENLGLGDASKDRLVKSIRQTVEGFNLKTQFKPEDIFDPSFLPAKAQRTLPPQSERKALK